MWILTLLIGAAYSADAPTQQAVPDPGHAALQRVVGGQPAPPGKWPEAAALTYAGGFVACSGVLVHPEWVLTAGHCSATVEQVLLSTLDASAPGEAIGVDAFVPYPDAFDTYDVALIHLETPAMSPIARSALDCIAEDHLTDGASATLVGYGSTSAFGGSAAGIQYEVDISIRDADCGDEYSGCNPEVMPAGELIAGGEGQDSCDGDSGGPLFLRTPYGPFLVGTTSRAAIPASQPCGDGGIYVRIDAIATWFEATTGEALQGPDCESINRTPTASAPSISVPMGGIGAVQIDVVDPDPFDTHTFDLETTAAHGTVGVGPRGEVIYGARPGFAGTDSLQVRVTDSGAPAQSTVLQIEVHVAAYQAPPGCSHLQGPIRWPWFALLVMLGLRRR